MLVKTFMYRNLDHLNTSD